MFKLWIFLWSIMAFNLIEASGPSSPTKDADSAAGSSSTPGLTENQRIDQFFRNAQFDLKKTIDPKNKKEVSASYINISSLKSKPEDVLKRAKQANLFQSAGKIQKDLYERYKDFKDIEITLDKDNLIIFSPSRSAIKNLLVRSILRDANLVSAKDQAQVLDKTSVKKEYQKDFDSGYKASVDFSELADIQSAYIKPKIIDSILKLDQKEFTQTNLALFNSSFFIYSLFPKDTNLKTFDIHLGITGKIDLKKTFEELKDLINKIPTEEERTKSIRELENLESRLKLYNLYTNASAALEGIGIDQNFSNISWALKRFDFRIKKLDFETNDEDNIQAQFEEILNTIINFNKTYPIFDTKKEEIFSLLKDFSKKAKDAYKKADEAYMMAKKPFQEIQNKLIIIDLKLPENPSDPEMLKMKNEYESTIKPKINIMTIDLTLYLQASQLLSIYDIRIPLIINELKSNFLLIKIHSLLEQRKTASTEEKANLTAQMIPLYEEMQSIFTKNIEPLNTDQIFKVDQYEMEILKKANQIIIENPKELYAPYLEEEGGVWDPVSRKYFYVEHNELNRLDFIKGIKNTKAYLKVNLIEIKKRIDETTKSLADAAQSKAEAAAADAQSITLDQAKASQSEIQNLRNFFNTIPVNSRSAYEEQFQNAEKTINELVIALDYIETAQSKADDAQALNTLEAAQTALTEIQKLRDKFNKISPNIKDPLENRFADLEYAINYLEVRLNPVFSALLSGLFMRTLTEADLEPEYQDKGFSKAYEFSSPLDEIELQSLKNKAFLNAKLVKKGYIFFAKKFNEMYKDDPSFTPIDPKKALIYVKEVYAGGDNTRASLLFHFIELEE